MASGAAGIRVRTPGGIRVVRAQGGSVKLRDRVVVVRNGGRRRRCGRRVFEARPALHEDIAHQIGVSYRVGH